VDTSLTLNFHTQILHLATVAVIVVLLRKEMAK